MVLGAGWGGFWKRDILGTFRIRDVVREAAGIPRGGGVY